MGSLASYIDRVENFESLTQKEQVKLLSYFYVHSSSQESFSSPEIKRCFEEEKLTVPTNVSHELARLSSQKPPVLLKKGKAFSFHRGSRKELDSMYTTNIDRKTVEPSSAVVLDLFNCYVRVGEKKQIILAVDKSEIEKMLSAIRDGIAKVLVNGRYVEVMGFESFRVYNLSLLREATSKGEAKRLMELENNLLGTKWSLSTIKRFGIEVTEQFQIPELKIPAERNGHEYFVDLTRIAELKNISSSNFDLSSLIRKCEELNINFPSGAFFSTALLVRSIIDHVPPIFGKTNFADVAGAHGSKSFRDSMIHLDKSSRKIADAHLHTHIRNKEILPNKTQVNFSRDVDVLLAEIVRVLK